MKLKKLAYSCSPSVIHPLLKRLEASDVGLRLARGVFWSVGGTVISRGMMLCATILVARIMGKTVYGELGMIQSTFGMFGVFAGFGLGLTSTKYVAEFRQNNPVRAGRIIGLSGLFAMASGGIISLGVLISAPWLAEHTINAPHLTGPLRIGALILFVSALNGAQTGALSGFESFKSIAQVNLCTGLISFPILVCGAYFGGLTGAVWALAINLCFNWLLNHLALRKAARLYNVPFSVRNCGREWPVLWKFSLPAVLAGSMVGPVNWVCNAILVNRPDGYGEMGLYNAANQWFALLVFLPAIISSVVLPIFSEQLSQNNAGQSTKTLVLLIKVNLLIVTPLLLFAGILSPYIMSLYGEDFGNGWPTLIVVLITAWIVIVPSPIAQIIAASGKMWAGFAMNAGWALLFLLATLLLVDYGSLGLAAAKMLSYIAHTVWTVWFVRRLLRNDETI